MTSDRSLSTDFWRFWGAGALSNLGDGIRLTALPLLTAATTRSAFAVSAVLAITLLPWATVGIIGGAPADRLDRQKLILAGQTVRGGAVGALAILAAADAVSLSSIYIVAFVLGLGEVVVDSASQAAIPKLAKPSQLEQANSKMVAAEILTNEVLGAPIGALLFGIAVFVPFGVDAATFLLAALLVATIRTPLQDERSTMPVQRLRSDIADGLRFVLDDRLLRGMTISVGCLAGASAAGNSIFVLLVLDELDGTEAVFGIMIGIGALGGVLGSLVARHMVERIGRRRSLIGSTLLIAASIIALGLSPNILAATAVTFVATGVVATHNVISRSIRQAVTPDQLLGRAVASFRLVGRGAAAVGAALGGLIASLTTVRTTYIAAGMLSLAGTALITRATTDLEGA